MTSLTDKSTTPIAHPALPWRPGLAGIHLRRITERGVLRLLGWAGLALAILGFLALVQFASPNLVGTDGYYHIKLADIMRHQGLKIEFPWLPRTILSPGAFYDHHMLFHAALIPFTLGDLVLGAKWASVLFAGLACLSVGWLFVRQGVPLAGLWALGVLAISDGFLYRMSMPRAQSLSLLVLVIGLQWILSGKTWQLAALGFIYVWLYDAFPLLLILAGLHCLAAWLSEGQFKLKPVLFVGLGIGLGLLINPYFPENLVFIARHLLPKLGDPTSVRVGNEWYPYTTAQLLANSPLALAAFAAGVLGLGLRAERLDRRSATALLAAIFFGALLLQSRRFIEYFPPFALIFAALAWAPLLDQHVREPLPPNPGSRLAWAQGLRQPRLAGALILVVLLLPGLWLSGKNAAASVADSLPRQRYQLAATWLANSTPPGALVFQTDWDDFTRLFFYDTHNTYLVGLDPTYLELADPGQYRRWEAISAGRVERPSQAIQDEFGAGYVLTDRQHQDFIRRAEADPAMKVVFRDQDAIIFQISAAQP